MEKMSTLFGMISSKNSLKYTNIALKSFFLTTEFKKGDRFILIDNDNCWMRDVNGLVIKNEKPMSFAANINLLLRIADRENLDLILMSNDVVFTPGWREPLEKRDDIITLPSCNQTYSYFDENQNLLIPSSLTIEEFTNPEKLFFVANEHKKMMFDYYERLHTSFYVFRLPRIIYYLVGFFDESFGKGGGEDVDYRIRASLFGFDTKFVTTSYLLHFQGASTWRSGEDMMETKLRNEQYFNRFSEKWSIDSANLFLQIGNHQAVKEKYQIELDWKFSDLMKKLNVRYQNSKFS